MAGGDEPAVADDAEVETSYAAYATPGEPMREPREAEAPMEAPEEGTRVPPASTAALPSSTARRDGPTGRSGGPAQASDTPRRVVLAETLEAAALVEAEAQRAEDIVGVVTTVGPGREFEEGRDLEEVNVKRTRTNARRGLNTESGVGADLAAPVHGGERTRAV